MSGGDGAKVRVLHVGVGVRGRHWLDIVRDNADFESAALVDNDDASLAAARSATDPSLPGFSNLEEALEATGAEAAIIASPSWLHAEQTMRCLDHGLAVLVEKPFTQTVAQALAVVEHAKRVGAPVIVAENFRFAPAERTIRDFVQNGSLGAVTDVSFVDRRRMPASTQGGWIAHIDYPQLFEVGVHHFDSMRAFFPGTPTRVQARAWNPAGSDYQHGACTEALLDIGDVRVQYLGALTSHRYSCTISIEGENGTLWSNRRWVFWRARDSRFFRPVKLSQVPAGDEKKYPREGTTSLLNALRDALANGTPAETAAEDNLWTIGMVEAAALSDRERRTVAVDELLSATAKQAALPAGEPSG